MPYITNEEKLIFDKRINNIFIENGGVTPGQLNYCITKLIIEYLNYKGLNYTHINDIIGVLNASNDEFYRKIVSKYEDLKEMENGKVYPEISKFCNYEIIS